MIRTGHKHLIKNIREVITNYVHCLVETNINCGKLEEVSEKNSGQLLMGWSSTTHIVLYSLYHAVYKLIKSPKTPTSTGANRLVQVLLAIRQ